MSCVHDTTGTTDEMEFFTSEENGRKNGASERTDAC